MKLKLRSCHIYLAISLSENKDPCQLLHAFVTPNYLDAVVETEEGEQTITELNADILTLCQLQFPSQCSESALTSATSSPEPTACPSSAGSTMPTFLLLPVALIIRLVNLFQ